MVMEQLQQHKCGHVTLQYMIAMLYLPGNTTTKQYPYLQIFISVLTLNSWNHRVLWQVLVPIFDGQGWINGRFK